MPASYAENSLFKIILFTLILGGIAARFWVLLVSGEYWFDEIIAVKIAQTSFTDSLQYLKYENNPPLYFWILGIWGRLFGFGEVPIRLLSLTLGIFTIPALYFLGKGLFDKKTGMIAALIFSLSPFAIYYSTEARMYSLLFLLCSLSLYFFWILVKNERSDKRWGLFLYGLSTLAALYTHITAIALFAIQGIFLLWKRKVIKHPRAIFGVMMLVGFIWTPWLLYFLADKIALAKEGFLLQGWYFQHTASLPIFLLAPIMFIRFSEGIPFVNFFYWVLASLLLFFAVCKGVGRGIRQKTRFESLFRCHFNQNNIQFALLGVFLPLFGSSLLFNLEIPKYYRPLAK